MSDHLTLESIEKMVKEICEKPVEYYPPLGILHHALGSKAKSDGLLKKSETYPYAYERTDTEVPEGYTKSHRLMLTLYKYYYVDERATNDYNLARSDNTNWVNLQKSCGRY
jgi:hypothetical protein